MAGQGTVLKPKPYQYQAALNADLEKSPVRITRLKPARPIKKTSSHEDEGQTKHFMKNQAKATLRAHSQSPCRTTGVVVKEEDKQVEPHDQRDDGGEFLPTGNGMKRCSAPSAINMKGVLAKKNKYQLSPDLSDENIIESPPQLGKGGLSGSYFDSSDFDIQSESMVFETGLKEAEYTKSYISELEQLESLDETVLIANLAEYLKRVKSQNVEHTIPPRPQNIPRFEQIKSRTEAKKSFISTSQGKSLTLEPEKRISLSLREKSNFTPQFFSPYEASNGDKPSLDLKAKDNVYPSTLHPNRNFFRKDSYTGLHNSDYLKKENYEGEHNLSSTQPPANLKSSSNVHDWLKHNNYREKMEHRNLNSVRNVTYMKPPEQRGSSLSRPQPQANLDEYIRSGEANQLSKTNPSNITNFKTKSVRTTRPAPKKYTQKGKPTAFCYPSRNDSQRYGYGFRAKKTDSLSSPKCQGQTPSATYLSTPPAEYKTVEKSLKGWGHPSQCTTESLEHIGTRGFKLPTQSIEQGSEFSSNGASIKSSIFPTDESATPVHPVSIKALRAESFKHSNMTQHWYNLKHDAPSKITEVNEKAKGICTARGSPPLLRNDRKDNQVNKQVISRKPKDGLDKEIQPHVPKPMGRQGQKQFLDSEPPKQPVRPPTCEIKGEVERYFHSQSVVSGSKQTGKTNSTSKPSSGIPRLIGRIRSPSPKQTNLPSNNIQELSSTEYVSSESPKKVRKRELDSPQNEWMHRKGSGDDVKTFPVPMSENTKKKLPVPKAKNDSKVNEEADEDNFEIKQLDKETAKNKNFHRDSTRSSHKEHQSTKGHTNGENNSLSKEQGEMGCGKNTNDLLLMFTNTLRKLLCQNQGNSQKKKHVKDMKVMLKIYRSKKNAPTKREVGPMTVDTTTDTAENKSDNKNSQIKKEDNLQEKSKLDVEVKRQENESEVKGHQESESEKPSVEEVKSVDQDEKVSIVPEETGAETPLKTSNSMTEIKQDLIRKALSHGLNDADPRQKDLFLSSKPPTVIRAIQKDAFRKTFKPPSMGHDSSLAGSSDYFYSLLQNTATYESEYFSATDNARNKHKKCQRTSQKSFPEKLTGETKMESIYSSIVDKSSDSMDSYYTGQRPPSVLKFLSPSTRTPSSFKTSQNNSLNSHFRSHLARWRFILFIILLPISLSLFSTYFYLRIK